MKNLSNENVIHTEKDGIQYLQFRKLLEYKSELKHAYSLGTDLNFRTKCEEDCKTNSYEKFCKIILDEDIKNIVKPNLEHTGNVQITDVKMNKEKPDILLPKYNKTDGLITNKKNMILSTTNADCILLLFYDPVKKVIANVHSGWKGTVQRIAVNTVKKMVKEFNCNPSDIICCITPSIRKCHFEVEKDVKDIYEEEFKDIISKQKKGEIIEEKIPNKKWNIDTVLINKIILEEQGLKPENIIDSGICTVCNSDLIHSYRAEKQIKGLETALIELK